MKICIFHPFSDQNQGYKMILDGCTDVLHEVIGTDFEMLSCDTAHSELDLNIVGDYKEWKQALTKVLDFKPDIFVVTGIPWIWDMWEASKKYRIMTELVGLLDKGVKKIAMGIGSCLPLAPDSVSLYMLKDGKRKSLKEIFDLYNSFAFVSSRDSIAQKCFDEASINSLYSISPSCFISIKPVMTDSGKPVLFFHNPLEGQSKGVLDDYYIADYITYQERFIKKYKPEVIVATKEERIWCISSGIENPHLEGDWQNWFPVLSKASFVVSGRVQGAIAAKLMGLQTYILPTDTRFLAATRIGAEPILPWGNLDNYGPGTDSQSIFDFSAERERIVERLKKVLQ